ncbi:hypothetical protein BSKO_11321 [Bryopsis sp. KO-2023]|nr:hypothetical protein BSKO_11321 [Bryopsis sp. KO-2023]
MATGAERALRGAGMVPGWGGIEFTSKSVCEWFQKFWEVGPKGEIDALRKRISKREAIERGLILGNEVELDSGNNDRQSSMKETWTVIYKSNPWDELRRGKEKKPRVEFSWTEHCEENLWTFEYAYDSMTGHSGLCSGCEEIGLVELACQCRFASRVLTQNWSLEGLGKKWEKSFKAKGNVDVNFNFDTDDVAAASSVEFGWPILDNRLTVEQGLKWDTERGCAWNVKASQSQEKGAIKRLEFRSYGYLDGEERDVHCEAHTRCSEKLGLEFETDTKITGGGGVTSGWSARLDHKTMKNKSLGVTCNGSGREMRSVGVRWKYSGKDTQGLSWSANVRRNSGPDIGVEYRWGQYKDRDPAKGWGIKAIGNIANRLTSKRFHICLFLPL